jgi:UDP-GlcNAc:undecaprenyl-phosphate GlcNAc-1-phosphate transferase
MVAVYCAVFLLSIFISAGFTWGIRNLARHYGWGSGSMYSHHIHARQIPRLGGLAVFVAFLAVFAAYLLATPWLGSGARMIYPPLGGSVLKLLAPAVFLFLTGLIDDLRGLSARAKLLGQIIGGVLLYAQGLHLFGPALLSSHPWAGMAVNFGATVFFVVLMCNAINLIDGLDGLAAGVSLFSMISLLVFACVAGAAPVAVTTLILGGAAAGFLIFNFSPASIFLGDSGSMFLGFMLSGLVIALPRKESALTAALLPVFCFALPLADTTISVLRRFLRRRPLFQADRGHVHHMLLNLGQSHRAAVCILYGVAAVCTILSLVLLSPSNVMLISAGALLLLLIFFCVRKLGYQEFAELDLIWQRLSAYRATEANVAVLPNGNHKVPAHTQHPARPAVVPAHSQVEMELEEGEIASPSMLPEMQAEEAAG